MLTSSQAIGSLPRLVDLELRAPALHPAADHGKPVQIPRYSPFFLERQRSRLLESTNEVERGLGFELAPSTPNEDDQAPQRLFVHLETLKLENLSAIGVRARGNP